MARTAARQQGNGMNVFRRQKEHGPDREQRPAAGLPMMLPSVLVVLFLALVAVSSSYLVGIMFGRSQWEDISPFVAGKEDFLREETTAADEETVAGEDSEQTEEPEQNEPGILAAEDLRFARVLRAAPGENVDQVTPPLAPAQPAVPPRTGTDAIAPSAVPAMPPGMQAAVPEGQTAPPATPATMFDYVFQVGAFRDAGAVDGLRQRLEGRGLRTRMEKSGRYYLVLVLLRGNAERAAEIPRIMHELRLGDPIQRSRKPVLR